MSSPAQPVSSTEQNRRLIHRWFDEVWNQGKREFIRELLAPDGVLHDGSNKICGPAEFEAFYDNLRKEVTDIRVTPGPSVCEGDTVCLRWRVDCQHRATGRPLSFTGISMCRIRDGKFVEAWQNWDAAEMHAQLNS